MMARRENDHTSEEIAIEHNPLLDAYVDKCADLCEQVLSGDLSWDQMSESLFGSLPSTGRWTLEE